jgi:hypothetical protein
VLSKPDAMATVGTRVATVATVALVASVATVAPLAVVAATMATVASAVLEQEQKRVQGWEVQSLSAVAA